MSENESVILNEIQKQLELIFVGDGLTFSTRYDFNNKLIIDIDGKNKESYICLINFLKIKNFKDLKSIVFTNINFNFSNGVLKELFILLSKEFQEDIQTDYLFLREMETRININIEIRFDNCCFIKSKTEKLKIIKDVSSEDIVFDKIIFQEMFSFYKCSFSRNITFKNSNFAYLALVECELKDTIVFNNVVFNNNPYFKFKNNNTNIVFNGSQFNVDFNFYNSGLGNAKKVNFMSCIFKDIVIFSGVGKDINTLIECSCGLFLIKSVFEKSVFFGNMKFKGGNTIASLEFKSDVVFTSQFLDNNNDGRLIFNNFIIHKRYDFNYIYDIHKRELNIFETHFKGDVVFPNPKDGCILKCVNILKCIFDGMVDFTICDFKEDVKIIQCIFNKDLSFAKSKFSKHIKFMPINTHLSKIINIAKFFNIKRKHFDFIENKVKDNIDFSDVSFEISPNFQSSIFEKLVILYKTKFKEIPNFYSASFSSSAVLDMPLVDIKDYSFNHLKYEIKNKNDLIDIKGVRECLNIFKNALLKTNNILEASKYKVLELYAKELELDCKLKNTENKENKENQEEKITIKERFDRWFLKLNRATSDHHTDFLKILLFTLSVIGGYFMINFGLSFDEKTINSICNLVDLGLAMYGVSVVIFLLCLGYEFLFVLKGFSKDKGWLIFIFLAICLLGLRLAYSFNVSEFGVFLPMIFIGILAMIFILLANNIKYTFISFAAAGFIGILCTPSIITPFLGVFSEDARNHYLYKAIDELDSQKALDLSKQILAKEPTSELNAKKTLKDYKNELKSSKLLDESPELKRAIAIDGGVSRLNIAYYLVLAFCIFALQKTMRKNSIIPS